MANRFFKEKEKEPIKAKEPIDNSIQYNWDKWRILGLNPEEIAYLRDKVGLGENLITTLSEGFPELDLNSLGIRREIEPFSGLSYYDLSKHNNSIYEALGAIYGNLVDQQTKRMLEDRRIQLENQKYQRPFTNIFDYNYPNTLAPFDPFYFMNQAASAPVTADTVREGSVGYSIPSVGDGSVVAEDSEIPTVTPVKYDDDVGAIKPVTKAKINPITELRGLNNDYNLSLAESRAQQKRFWDNYKI